MMYLGDFPVGATVHVPWNSNLAAGGSVTIATDGTLKVYQLPSETQRTSASGITFNEDHDSITGRHLESIDLSDDTDAGFYAAGADYGVARDGMTIDGQTVNVWLALFSIENRAGLRPTTAGRTLDVTADGRAGVDWGNVENADAAVNLTNTTVKTATDVETATTDLQGRLPAALVGGRMSSSLDAIPSEPAAVFAWGVDNLDAILAFIGAVATNRMTETATTQLLRNRANTATIATATVSDDDVTGVRGSFT